MEARGPAYSIEFLRARAEELPKVVEAPPFPAVAGDPLAELYPVVGELYRQALAYQGGSWVRPEKLGAGPGLLKHPSRHDALLGLFRWFVWAAIVQKRLPAPMRPGGYYGLHCLETLTDRIARGDAKLGDAEVLELISYAPRRSAVGAAHFPRRALVAVLDFHSRRGSLPRAALGVLGEIRCVHASTNNPVYAASIEQIDRVLARHAAATGAGGGGAGVGGAAGRRLSGADAARLAEGLRDAAVRFRDGSSRIGLNEAVSEVKLLGPGDLGAVVVEMARLMGEFADRVRALEEADEWPHARWVGLSPRWSGWYSWRDLLGELLHRRIELNDDQWRDIFDGLGRFEFMAVHDHSYLPAIVKRFTRGRVGEADGSLTEAVRAVALALAASGRAEEQRLVRALLRCVRAPEVVPIQPGEVWADAAIAELGELGGEAHGVWVRVLVHCTGAQAAAPSERWLRGAGELVSELGGPAVVAARIARWFPRVDRPSGAAAAPDWRWGEHGAHAISDVNQTILRGLCWIAGTIRDAALARALGKLALSAYRKVPGIGPRAVKVGNAAVWALGRMPGMDAVGQLAMLRVKVKFGTAQKGIEKALAAAAEREGLPREEMDELGVPSYGLTEVGRRVEVVEGYGVELVVTGVGSGGVEMRFFRPDGKGQKSMPAAIKGSEELKEMKAAVKDIAAMLPAQQGRIDSLFLENKSWAWGVWRERYLDHPLVGVVARRLIWRVSDGKAEAWRAVAWVDGGGRAPEEGEIAGGAGEAGKEDGGRSKNGGLVDITGAAVRVDEESAVVRLWHPIEADGGTDEVLAWRRFFEEREIRQPFKQAHREVYLLTDAERGTGTYSNRFAAHVLRQHQFNALCGVRGWKNKLRLMVDQEFPPATRLLRGWGEWGMRAEFWIDGAGDAYGQDTNEAGTYLHLVTDQVRFYSEAAADAGEPMRLEDVPRLVFSEVMRDVDLFVGVSSVGNNPQWQDGGPDGRHQDYWWRYGFGDLSQAGAGRRELLERLLPRLKIAGVCSLVGDKFLRVQGKVRAYKIHLGSGNILMEPEDQYLCIVPSGRDEMESGKVFLPFEGDRTLAIILSKAFMLAEDDKIKDGSIVSQIGRR